VSAFQKPDLSPSQKMKLLSVRGLARRLSGDLEAARSFLDQAVTYARAVGSADLASSFNNRQIVLGMLGLYPQKVADLKEAIKLYRDAGMTLNYASSLSSLGSLLGLMGQYEEAEAKLLEAHEALLPFDNSGFLCTNECGLCELYLAWRPPHGLSLAQRYAQLALDRARLLEPRRLGYALCVASTVANELGQVQRSLTLANECLELDGINPEVRLGGLMAKAAALETLGSRAEAISALELARSIAIRDHRWIDLELAKLRGDLEAGRACLEWFFDHGLMGVVEAAQKKWPELKLTRGEASAAAHEPLASARISVLGAVKLERDGQPVTYRGRKRTEILAYLLEARIAGRFEVSTLDLVDALYPDEPEAEARNTLKQQVYLIRLGLGAESVLSTSNGYALGAVSSDAEDFLRTTDSSLWRGAYLSGFGEGWRLGVRDALTLALRSRIEASLQTDGLEAARLGQILCEMEPYDPAALRLAVHALEASGDERAAHRLYLDGRARLLEVGESLPVSLGEFLVVPA
jgi:tetratricopeptide (TPR) repeat protein